MNKVGAGITIMDEVMRTVPFEEVSSAGRCVECHKYLVASFVFCPYCGTRIARRNVGTQYIKASTAAVTEEDLK